MELKFIEVEFDLTKIQLGWAVSSLTLSATLAMMVSGPLSDRYGRKILLMVAAMLYTISAVGSAMSRSFNPHCAQIISFRGKGRSSGASSQTTEQVAHW